jgi:hypothetical protein
MTSAKYHKVYNRARPSIDPAEPSRKSSCFGKRVHRRRARGSRKFEAAGPRESQRLRTALAGRSDAAARDSTGHQNVIGNDRQPSRDVPIVWTASGGEPPQQPEVSQRDPSSDVVRDRPSILPRGRRFKSCPRYHRWPGTLSQASCFFRLFRPPCVPECVRRRPGSPGATRGSGRRPCSLPTDPSRDDVRAGVAQAPRRETRSGRLMDAWLEVQDLPELYKRACRLTPASCRLEV